MVEDYEGNGEWDGSLNGRKSLGDEFRRILIGKGNANCSPDFQKYRSNFTETRHFKRKIHFFPWGSRGLPPFPLLAQNHASLLDPPLRPTELQPDLRLWISSPTKFIFYFRSCVFWSVLSGAVEFQTKVFRKPC